MNTTVRQMAVANEDRSIEESQSRAIAQRAAERKPRSALRALAERLQVSEGGLQATLLATAFKGASPEEFMALVIVANTYNLNPLLKEIYAFPKKGGGIVPMVGIDGWIKLANDHPQFDGIEFDHIVDQKGNLIGMEGILYRKDRNRPTKMLIHTDEFKVGTNPNWNSRPRHMTWVRCYCQTVRVGLGLTGLAVEGDEPGADYQDVTPPRLPRLHEFNQSTGEVIDQPEPARDPATGMTEVDEETARALDAGQSIEEELGDEIPDFDQRKVAEETAQAIDGPLEQAPEDTATVWLRGIRSQVEAATTAGQIDMADREWLKNRAAYDDQVAAEVDAEIAAARRRVREGGKG